MDNCVSSGMDPIGWCRTHNRWMRECDVAFRCPNCAHKESMYQEAHGKWADLSDENLRLRKMLSALGIQGLASDAGDVLLSAGYCCTKHGTASTSRPGNPTKCWLCEKEKGA